MARYLENCWYMAGWAEELGKDGFTRTLLDLPLYFYRREADGGITAIHDRCPHRFAPLSKGTRVGDTLVCGYHGLEFGTDGQCTRNPFSERIPTGAKLRTFDVCEKDSIIWLWAGEKGTADTSLIPDFSFLPDSPTNRSIRGYTLMKANYEYGTDNLLDLSHIEYVHKKSFAGQGVIFSGTHDVKVEGTTIHSNWWMPKISPPSIAQGRMPDDAIVDHWLDMRWNVPASMKLSVGVCPHGAKRTDGFEALQAHILTPVTEHESHYFWASNRNYLVDSKEEDENLTALFRQAFDEEDKPIIEAAYTNVRGKDFWGEKPLSLGVDAAGARARRVLEKLIKAEQKEKAA